ncbi:MAG: radical SAM protein [Halieaceae bacterium]|jgi:MoaA/NifB/PqqE/SkfB family radical SAM enzyme|nr:radical SAM protein [Halieaceae bacterium]
MKPYKIAVNMEWSSKCNARCVMCPQHLIEKPQLMKEAVFERVLQRISPEDVFRVVVAGYGEPTTHPDFMQHVESIRQHPVRFDMASNAQQLDEEKIRHLDGAIDTLLVSFSSIVPEVYRAVHVNLDHQRVMDNIQLAQRLFKKTRLAISLTPLNECIETLQETIDWFKSSGIHNLTMSPTLYNRGGSMVDQQMATNRLRQIIKENGLHSQELDFVPAFKDIAQQYFKNDFQCIPRNIDLFITASGDYLYCYNDITHKHTFGHVAQLGIREALEKRQGMGAIPELCDSCNMRDRYRAKEVAKVVVNYASRKLIPTVAA